MSLEVLIPFLIMLFLLIIILIAVMEFLVPTKSRRYRRELTDLYVAGRIRQLATEDKIDLNQEYESFKKWVKKKQMEDKDLDNVIEGDLKDRVTEPKEVPKKF